MIGIYMPEIEDKRTHWFYNKLRIIFAVIRNVCDIERQPLRNICIGKGIDVGCGNSKVTETCIGIDIYGKGELGKYGSQKNKPSVADYRLNGDDLTIFKDNELDFVVASHNLEHYSNPKKTLIEWKRVLKIGGKVGVVVPNNNKVYSIELDPTHKVSFTLESLERLFKEVGFKILRKGDAIKNWSIFLIAEKGELK